MRDGKNLIQPSKHLFTFKRGINATRKENQGTEVIRRKTPNI
jgi:hypothetical protein